MEQLRQAHRHLGAENQNPLDEEWGSTGELYLPSNSRGRPGDRREPLKADSARTGKVHKDGRRIRPVYAGEYERRVSAPRIEPGAAAGYASSRREREERALAEERMEQVIAEMGLPDMAVHSDELPWVPQGERVWFKPLRFDLTSGRWINLLKVEGGGKVNRHRHAGGQVLGYCIEGSWHYLERDWVARPGTLVYEPPGDIHTLVVDDDAGYMITLFILEGSVQYIDDEDNLIYQDDVFSKLERYLKFCEEQGVEPLDLRY